MATMKETVVNANILWENSIEILKMEKTGEAEAIEEIIKKVGKHVGLAASEHKEELHRRINICKYTLSAAELNDCGKSREAMSVLNKIKRLIDIRNHCAATYEEFRALITMGDTRRGLRKLRRCTSIVPNFGDGLCFVDLMAKYYEARKQKLDYKPLKRRDRYNKQYLNKMERLILHRKDALNFEFAKHEAMVLSQLNQCQCRCS